LGKVVEFRNKLAAQGLTSSYPSHEEFGEHIRGGLLRTIRDILREAGEPILTKDLEPEAVDASSYDAALALANEYERVRRTMSSGNDRTRVMAALFSRMKALAPKVRAAVTRFEESNSPGMRLMAVAILNMFPSVEHLDWLAQRLDPKTERPFLAYQSEVGILEAVVGLPAEDCGKLRTALATAKGLASQLKENTDRINVLSRAEQELLRKCGPN
jgi:hypothetical protein